MGNRLQKQMAEAGGACHQPPFMDVRQEPGETTEQPTPATVAAATPPPATSLAAEPEEPTCTDVVNDDGVNVVLQLTGTRGDDGIVSFMKYPNLFIMPEQPTSLHGFVEQPPSPQSSPDTHALHVRPRAFQMRGQSGARQDLALLRRSLNLEQELSQSVAGGRKELDAERRAMKDEFDAKLKRFAVEKEAAVALGREAGARQAAELEGKLAAAQTRIQELKELHEKQAAQAKADMAAQQAAADKALEDQKKTLDQQRADELAAQKADHEQAMIDQIEVMDARLDKLRNERDLLQATMAQAKTEANAKSKIAISRLQSVISTHLQQAQSEVNAVAEEEISTLG